ncbi:MAG: 6-phosphofructokinase [Saprospiraceae bacterium]
MINGDIKRLETKDMGNIIHRGGTVLKTARSARFMTLKAAKTAYENLIFNDIDALMAIGGSGSFTSAHQFMKEFGYSCCRCPAPSTMICLERSQHWV